MWLNMLMNKTLPWKEERDRFSSRILILSKRVKLHTVPSDVGKLTGLGADDEILAISIPRMNRSWILWLEYENTQTFVLNNFAAGSLISEQFL